MMPSFIRRLTLAVLALCLSVPVSATEGPETATYYEPSDTVLILGAVPQEVPPFVEAMEEMEVGELWGIPYWAGRIADQDVVVAITGIGKTYTASTATIFMEYFSPRLVLMSGTGARVNQDLRTGDVIVAHTTYEHDYGSLTREGMVYRPFNGPDDGAELENGFSPPDSLLAIADKAIETYEAPEVTANGSTYTIAARRGVVSSSDLFGVTEQRLTTLREKFNTDIMEMETAPLLHICVTFGVPCIVVRAGSNVAQEAPNDDYLRLGPIAAKQAAYFSLHLLTFLSEAGYPPAESSGDRQAVHFEE